MTVAALLAGCGSSDSDDGGDEFVRNVDALCQRANPELVQINTALTRARDAARAGRVSPRETFETFERLLRRAAAVTDRFVAGLRKVAPPAEEREFHHAFLESVEEGASDLRLQIGAAQRRDATALRDLSQKAGLANARSKGLVTGHGGFRFCGRT